MKKKKASQSPALPKSSKSHPQLPIQIAPSILSGDFGRLGAEAARIADAGADAIHIDIMDGHFVPNLTLGPRAVAAINRATPLFLDVHLMIYNPYAYIEQFVEAGADRITIHLEATEDVADTLKYIRKCGVAAGLALCPETSASLIPPYLDKCDLILLMTVHPGFGGQEFMPEVLEKIQFTRMACTTRNVGKGGVIPKDKKEILAPFDIQVDGGITDQTAKLCYKAGANVFVSGTHLFKAASMKAAIQKLRGL